MTTLIQVLCNAELNCNRMMAIYAQKINEKFVYESPARVEQRQVEEVLADGFELFATNEEACFDRTDWCQGDLRLYQAWARVFIIRKQEKF